MIWHIETSIADANEAEVAAAREEAMQTQTLLAVRVFASAATAVTDEQVLEMPDLFPTWAEVLDSGARLAKNTSITKDGTVYRVMTDVTPQEGQPPDGPGMLAVYRPIEKSHAGTVEDPIPWVYGMDCRAGQYFSYEGHVYRVAEGGDMIPCIWAPGTPGLWQWELIS